MALVPLMHGFPALMNSAVGDTSTVMLLSVRVGVVSFCINYSIVR